MRKTALWTTALALFLGATVVAYGVTLGSNGRTDCPGTITCPLTGEEVCKDRCPLLDPARSDCPGKIVCTIDGELVCRDECPLGEASTKASALPPCCRGKE
ncbi:MAG: hypothetical protein IH899_06055 [Planctomycetes bacterium]|nr:hypothetical protein [Planctomycetota bacterium]